MAPSGVLSVYKNTSKVVDAEDVTLLETGIQIYSTECVSCAIAKDYPWRGMRAYAHLGSSTSGGHALVVIRMLGTTGGVWGKFRLRYCALFQFRYSYSEFAAFWILFPLFPYRWGYSHFAYRMHRYEEMVPLFCYIANKDEARRTAYNHLQTHRIPIRHGMETAGYMNFLHLCADGWDTLDNRRDLRFTVRSPKVKSQDLVAAACAVEQHDKKRAPQKGKILHLDPCLPMPILWASSNGQRAQTFSFACVFATCRESARTIAHP